MLQDLRTYQRNAGAQLQEREGLATMHNGGRDAQVATLAQTGCVLFDRSHWPWMQLTGTDRSTFLHNQSSNDIKSMQPGQGCETVILTSTARTLDLVTAYLTDDSIWLLGSPGRHQQLLTWFDRYIFFGDQVQVVDARTQQVAFSLLGSQGSAMLEQLGCPQLPQNLHDHQLLSVANIPVRVAVGSGLMDPGYTLMVAPNQALNLWQHLVEVGAIPMGTLAWDRMRIQVGRPQVDAELTENYNPLEAGLWHTVSFNKGCYIGQETIARLNTYNAVKQNLWGVRLAALEPPGTDIRRSDDNSKVGLLTSVVETPEGVQGLGYVKTKAGGAGLQVQVGQTRGELVDVPFLRQVPLNGSERGTE